MKDLRVSGLGLIEFGDALQDHRHSLNLLSVGLGKWPIPINQGKCLPVTSCTYCYSVQATKRKTFGEGFGFVGDGLAC